MEWPRQPRPPRGEMSYNLRVTLQSIFISIAVAATLVTLGYFIWNNAKHMDVVRESTERYQIEQSNMRASECITSGGAWIDEPVVMCVYSKPSQGLTAPGR